MRAVSTAPAEVVPSCRERQALRAHRAAVDRRAAAARRVARMLLPAAERAGGFTSTQLRIRPGGVRPARAPDAVLVLGDPPTDGLLTEAPALVCYVDLGGDAVPVDARFWLRLGAVAVWQVQLWQVRPHVLPGEVRVWTGVQATVARAPDVLELPVPSRTPLRVPVADLLDVR